MVLPVRIELTTSALPRMRSTTELRQPAIHAGGVLWASTRRLVKQGAWRKRMKPDRDRPMTSTPADARKARLAAALRQNLHRRKAAARAEAQAPDNPAPER